MNIFDNYLLIITKIILKNKESLNLNNLKNLENVNIEVPPKHFNFDLSTNISLVLSKINKINPNDLAKSIKDLLLKNISHFEKIEVAKPGFLNIKLSKEGIVTNINSILKDRDTYGSKKLNKKYNLEFVSANPTGPLHVGHCRGAIFGDVLSNLLIFNGNKVTKEYYINDYGNQIKNFVESVYLRIREIKFNEKFPLKENLYPGDYIKEIASNILENHKEVKFDNFKDCFEELKKLSKEVGSDNDKIKQVASISANNDQSIGSLIAEAMKFAHHNRAKYVGDPSFSEIPYDMLLSKKLACKKAREINLKKASTPKQTARTGSKINDSYKESKDTTHYSIVDKDGNAVSVTYTLGYSFGSGVTIPGTGILTNNQMNNFAHSYGIDDSYFRSSSPANKLEPLKRPMSTMTPVMVFDAEGSLKLITGSPGGSQIPGVILQVLINNLEFNLDIGAASMVPRIHQDSQSLSLEHEKFLSDDTLRILESYGHKLELSDTMGSTQSIEIIDGVRYGYADLRRPNAKVSVQ